MTNGIEGGNQSVLWVILVMLVVVFSPTKANSQFLDLQLQVDSKLTATTERPLSFGVISPNSGTVQVGLGDLNMGIFSVTALEQQMLLIELIRPDALVHDNPTIDTNIPLNLSARYGYSIQNYQNTFPLTEVNNSVRLESNLDQDPWNTIYIFVFGTITIGEVPDGVYSNQILLNVEYM